MNWEKKMEKLKLEKEKLSGEYAKEKKLYDLQKEVQQLKAKKSKVSGSGFWGKAKKGLSTAATNYGKAQKEKRSYGGFSFGSDIGLQSPAEAMQTKKKKKMSQMEWGFWGM